MNPAFITNLIKDIPKKGHSLTIIKAIELLEKDQYTSAASLAKNCLLPLILGSIWPDVWGDSDLDGSQILHYYIPDNFLHDFGYGVAVPGSWGLLRYKHSSMDYISHRFYGYGNSAEYAYDRYLAAVRAAKHLWGSYPTDNMAGWVVDDILGQSDPLNQSKKCWAEGTLEIDNPPQTRFGSGQTPASVLNDLYSKYSKQMVIFPKIKNPILSTVFLPNDDVLSHSPEWLDDKYGNACDVEAYSGWDGHNYVYYTVWSTDTRNRWMIFRAIPNSIEHAYFLLGWSLHLLQDSCLTIHTINDSLWTATSHNQIEDYFDEYIIKDPNYLPADNLNGFENATKWSSLKSTLPSNGLPKNPNNFFKERWYCNKTKNGIPDIKEYIIDASTLLSQNYRDFIKDNFSLTLMQLHPEIFYSVFALEFDLAIKATAGTLLKFYNEIEGGPKPHCD